MARRSRLSRHDRDNGTPDMDLRSEADERDAGNRIIRDAEFSPLVGRFILLLWLVGPMVWVVRVLFGV
jgi:hypothetical protein